MYVDLSILIALSVLLLLVVFLSIRVGALSDRLSDLSNGLEQQAEPRTVPAPNPFEQMEAYLYVRDRLDLHKGIPITTHWSASPDFLKLIADYCLEAKPGVIMECSSGVTSLVLARCCEINGGGHLYSLEDGETYAARGRSHIARYGLSAWADVLHAPLDKLVLGSEEYLWYAIDKIPDKSIDLLVIDGPSGLIQRNSRYPALPVLFSKLSDGCVVLMDDAAREDEREITRRWQAEFPGIRHEYIKTERGCSRFTVERGS